MSTTVNMASSLTNTIYTSVGVSCTNNRATIPITWANLNGYPELVVEIATEDVDASYHPAKVTDEYGNLHAIKLRMIDTSGEEMIVLDGIFSTTPFVRIVIYGGACTIGTITFELNVG